MSSDRHMEKGSKRKKKSRTSLSDKQYEYIDKKTRQEVYDALYSLETIYREDSVGTGTPQSIGENAKVPDIRWWLEEQRKKYNKQIETDGLAYYNSGLYDGTREKLKREIEEKIKKRTISERHIERIVKTDPRIVKGEGHTYHIDKVARFETRYQRPDMFGQDMLEAVMKGLTTQTVSRTGKAYKIPQEVIMTELIRRLGAFVVFLFIEAVRPFRDKCMNRRERNELVDYWKKNAIDIDAMFDMFGAILGTEWTTRREDKTLAPGEVNESDINKMLEALKKSCPDIYEKLIDARTQQVLSPDEVGRKENGEIGFVHGKTYRQGRTNY